MGPEFALMLNKLPQSPNRRRSPVKKRISSIVRKNMSQPFQTRRDATELGLTEIESCHHEESLRSASRDSSADHGSSKDSDLALRRELTDRSRRLLCTQYGAETDVRGKARGGDSSFTGQYSTPFDLKSQHIRSSLMKVDHSSQALTGTIAHENRLNGYTHLNHRVTITPTVHIELDER